MTDYAVSLRHKTEEESVEWFLSYYYPSLCIDDITSVFGFLEYTPLYGGRYFLHREISDKDVQWLRGMGIGIKIPLTNSFVSREEYEKSKFILDKYHVKGNSVIVLDHELRDWICEDFPDYLLEYSVIGEIASADKILDVHEMYDVINFRVNHHTDMGELALMPYKEKLRVFANIWCQFNCPDQLCYKILSTYNKTLGDFQKVKCSKKTIKRPNLGYIKYDLQQFIDIGISRFKFMTHSRSIRY